MDYSPLISIMYITDDPTEMVKLGHKIEKALPTLYTSSMMEKMYEGVERHIPNESPEKKEEMVYRAIYDWWAYGSNVDEEFYLHNVKNASTNLQIIGLLPTKMPTVRRICFFLCTFAKLFHKTNSP